MSKKKNVFFLLNLQVECYFLKLQAKNVESNSPPKLLHFRPCIVQTQSPVNPNKIVLFLFNVIKISPKFCCLFFSPKKKKKMIAFFYLFLFIFRIENRVAQVFWFLFLGCYHQKRTEHSEESEQETRIVTAQERVNTDLIERDDISNVPLDIDC